MTIFTSGYAIAGLDGNDAIAKLVALRPKRESWELKTLTPDIPPMEWMEKKVEVRGFGGGVYLETYHKFTDGFLYSLSRRIGSVLHLHYYANMFGFGCSYFVGGQKMVSRVTVAGDDKRNKSLTNEFNGVPTQELIRQLFALLTGSTLEDAMKTKKQKTVYYIQIP